MAGLVLQALAWLPGEGHVQERLLCYRCFHGLQWGCDVTKQPRRQRVLVQKGKLRSEDVYGDAPPVWGDCDYCIHIPTLEPVYVTPAGVPVTRAPAPEAVPVTAYVATPVKTTPVDPTPAVSDAATADEPDDDTPQMGLFG